MRMKMKVIALLLLFGVVLLSGCVGDEKPSPEENVTPEETVTPVENITPEENLTPEETVTEEENITSEETEPEDSVSPEENNTSVEPGVTSSDIRTTPYTVRLVNYRANPSSLDIKEGESVAWMNLEENPKRRLILVSEQSLFENKSLVYKRAFAYTFNETGDYSFYIVGQPKMSLNVSVAEP